MRLHQPKNLLLSGLIAAALVTSAALPAQAASATPERPADPAVSRAASTFTSTLQKDITIADGSMPSDFVSNAAGTTGYVTTHWGKTMHVVDLATEAVSGTIPLPSNGANSVHLMKDGHRALITLTNGYWSQGLAEVNLDSRTVTREFAAPFAQITATALSPSNDALFALGLSGEVAKLDPATGAVLAQTSTGGINLHGLAVSPDGSRLYVSGQPGFFTYSTEDLELLLTSTSTGFSDASELAFDTDPGRLYASDGSSPLVGVLNPATGETRASAPVGPQMSGIVGSDELNRAYSAVPSWSMVMAADLGAGIRSESYRTTPDPVFGLTENPVTGDLLASNGGWHNDGMHGSTVSIIYRPSVTDPKDAAATTLGEVVTLHSDATGIKAVRGGIQWQSSTDDGATWTDIEGETGNDLAVTVDSATATTTYRAAWNDDFWGRSGASAPAAISVPAPVITTDGPLPEGAVGSEYEPVIVDATGQSDLTWSASGLPAGLTLEKADIRAAAPSAVLSGTPTEAGTFTLTATVTDSFGTDSHDYTLVVAEGAVVPPTTPTPTDPATPAPTPAPTDPGTPGNPGDPTAPAPGDGSNLASTGAAPAIALGIGALLLALGAVMAHRRRTA